MNMKFLVAFFALVLVSAKRLPMVKVGSSDLPVNVVIFLKAFFKQIDGQKYFPESYNCMGNMTTVAPTIQSLLSEIYGDRVVITDAFINNYLKTVGLDDKYKAIDLQDINMNILFELTEWIPTIEELGKVPNIVR